MKITLVRKAELRSESAALVDEKSFELALEKVNSVGGKSHHFPDRLQKTYIIYKTSGGSIEFFKHIILKLKEKYKTQLSSYYTGGYSFKLNGISVDIDIEGGHRLRINANKNAKLKDLSAMVKLVNEFIKAFNKQLDKVVKVGQLVMEIKQTARKHEIGFDGIRFLGFTDPDGTIDMTVCPPRGRPIEYFSDDFIDDVMKKFSKKYKFLRVEVALNVSGNGLFSIDSATWYK